VQPEPLEANPWEMNGPAFHRACSALDDTKKKKGPYRAFAEYYLVGTLISTLVAVAGGLAINAVWH